MVGRPVCFSESKAAANPWVKNKEMDCFRRRRLPRIGARDAQESEVSRFDTVLHSRLEVCVYFFKRMEEQPKPVGSLSRLKSVWV